MLNSACVLYIIYAGRVQHVIFGTKSADCIWGSTVLYVFHINGVWVFFLGGKGGGGGWGIPLRHWDKENYKDLNLKKFDLRVEIEPTTSWIPVWRSNHQEIWWVKPQNFSRHTFCSTKFNHLYLGTGCVFWEGRGGEEHPIGTAQGEL